MHTHSAAARAQPELQAEPGFEAAGPDSETAWQVFKAAAADFEGQTQRLPGLEMARSTGFAPTQDSGLKVNKDDARMLRVQHPSGGVRHPKNQDAGANVQKHKENQGSILQRAPLPGQAPAQGRAVLVFLVFSMFVFVVYTFGPAS